MAMRCPTLPQIGRFVLLGVLGLMCSSVFPEGGRAVAQSADADWPMYQHDPAHSGRTPATAFNDGPLYLQWAYAFGERVEVEAQPVVSGGVIYQGVMNGEMHAINATTGQAIWVRQPGGPIPHTAAVYEGRVYFGSLDGKVYALSAADGSTAWQFSTGGPVVSAPAVVDGRLYIGSTDHNLYALDANTGAKLWYVETAGPVVSSPAVANGRVYFGSEDLKARCVNAVTGGAIWTTPLYGAGMHNTHPVVSDDGQVVIFLTVKAGGSSYVHNEGYPNASASANPVETWNTYYRAHPTYRYLYYLDAVDGHDLWNADTRRYVPMPIPYWGLLHPILGPDGAAWFPAPAGTAGNTFTLDHDNRLLRVNLATGETTQMAGAGSPHEFQVIQPEVGRHVFAGGAYYYTISEDLGVYRPSDGKLRALFSNGDPSGYNFGTHMHPHSPLPSRHLWRYGGAIAMGGVPGASPPIVANSMVYFTSYGWLYAVGPVNHGYNPATSFPPRSERLHELTYPRSDAPTYTEIKAEVAQRVADIVVRGPGNPPLAVRWEQCWDRMLNNEFTFEVYGFEADLVRVLAEAYPYLSSAQQTQLRAYLSTFVSNTLLNPDYYSYRTRCIRFGEAGIYVGDAQCSDTTRVVAWWRDNNPNLVGLRLYALWAYANTTGDWGAIEAHWSLITQQFQQFLDAYDPALGFCDFEEWLVGRLNVGAQIEAAQAVRDMAAHLSHTNTQAQAATLLANLLNGRMALANFVPNLYDTGQRQPARIRLNPDGTIVYEDIIGPNSPYNDELIPYSAVERNRTTDPSQVNWRGGSTYRVDAGVGFMYYPALSGYFPLSSELVARLRANLLDKTRYYVQSYEVNNPWWWMADLAHHTTGSGEHLYHSPTLAWTMFQVKARVLQEDWNTLVRQLPEPVSFNSRYDLYRLQNLVTLLEMEVAGPGLDLSTKTASSIAPRFGQAVTYTIVLRSSGDLTDTVYLTDTVPNGLAYVPHTLAASVGTPNDSAAPTLRWSGKLTSNPVVTVSYAVNVTEKNARLITNTVHIAAGAAGDVERIAAIIANGRTAYLPLVMRNAALHATMAAIRPSSEYSSTVPIYLPLIFGSSGQASALRRVNAPYFDGEVPFPETAVFWFGQVTPTDNYADVRVGYNGDELYWRLAAFDRRLWRDTTPARTDLTAWDAATLYLDLDGGGSSVPDVSAYRFVGQLSYEEEPRGDYQATYRGDGSGWTATSIPFTTIAGWRGDAFNNATDDRGWAITFRIPFASLGLSGPPTQGTIWRLALALHDRDDAAGTPVADQVWPEVMVPDRPATWGQLAFGLPTYTAPPATPGGTVTIRHKLNGAVVVDGAVGGGTLCGSGLDYWTEWGQANYAGVGSFNIQNQSDIADWPCFSRYYVIFPLDALPSGKAILSATLTLYQFGGAGGPGQAEPSLIQALTVAENWDEGTLTWNNAPLAAENVSQAWVDPTGFPGWPGVPRRWDVTLALVRAYEKGKPLRLVLYEADSAYHSGKYFVSSDIEDWNAVGRPTLTVVWGQKVQLQDRGH